jgi:hypothetical protein
MMTRDMLLNEMARSAIDEEKIYMSLTLSLFQELQRPNQERFDQLMQATASLTVITRQVLQVNPGLVKILRYCLAPVISQMRLGQIIGLGTTDSFEERQATPTDEQADRLSRWFNDYLDRDRFPWLANPKVSPTERRISESFAKLWTVSLLSNQNTATKYRTQRKERQEKAIAEVLQAMGLKFQALLGPPAPPPRTRRKPGDPPHPKVAAKLGGITNVHDVRVGHFVKEQKILGGSQKNQKADITVRPSVEELLFCIEAKAVGIKIDSTKRLKELNDKCTDWNGSALPVQTIGVCAGMFNSSELIATIKLRGVPIFFEHALDKLADFLRYGLYYGATWNPPALFPDVSIEEAAAALAKIKTATADAVEAYDSPAEG